ncbi:MAG: hypothetical protein H0X18_01980 [Geodermatophilaceae bacterium]|nr:hypothetical protein [Geodermatophilaceae bacterium]
MDRDNQPDIFSSDGAAHSFDVVIRGYDRAQVHDAVDRLDGELRVALADKDASAAHAAELASHLASVQTEVEAMRETAQAAAAPNFDSMGARISHMLKLAEEEANDIRRIAAEDKSRSQAEVKASAEEAARLRKDAKDEVQRMTVEAQDEARRVTEETKAAAAATVADAQKQADDLNERARASAAQAEADSKARLAKIEEDFQLAQKARRAEAARVEQERDRASRRDAQNRIEQAQRKSDDMVSAAERRVTGLDAQRAELHARLSKVRDILGGLPDIGTTTVIEANPVQHTSGSAGPGSTGPGSTGPGSAGPGSAGPGSAGSGSAGSGSAAPKATSGSNSNGAPEPKVGRDTGTAEQGGRQANAPKTEPVPAGSAEAAEAPTDVQKTPPPPPAAASSSWPVNAPTQAIHIPRQG